jgi:NTP pyrophosphatase (non-canonical NTP hydrolase)
VFDEPRLTPTIVNGLERRIAELERRNDELARERDRWAERNAALEWKLKLVRRAADGVKNAATLDPGNRMVRLCNRAVEVFGAASQTKKVAEECAELIAAICHHDDGKITTDELAEECAGVMIVSAQLAGMLGETLTQAMERQLDKLEAAIAAHSERKKVT